MSNNNNDTHEIDEWFGRHELLHDRKKYDRHNKVFNPLVRGVSGGTDVDQRIEHNYHTVELEMKPRGYDDTVRMTWGQYRALRAPAYNSEKQKVYILVYNPPINEEQDITVDDLTHIGNIRNMRFEKYWNGYASMVCIPLTEFYTTDASHINKLLREWWSLCDTNTNFYENESWKTFEYEILQLPLPPATPVDLFYG